LSKLGNKEEAVSALHLDRVCVMLNKTALPIVLISVVMFSQIKLSLIKASN